MIHGGAQENTLLTLQGIRDMTDWEVHLVTGPETGQEGSLLPAAMDLGIPCYIVPELKREIDLHDDYLAYKQLKHLFGKQGYDVVHTHSSKAGVLGRIAAHEARVPCIVHTIHGLAFDEYQKWWRNLIYRLTERIAAENVDRIIAVCDNMQNRAIEAGMGRPGQYRTIYSGFPLEPFLAVPPRASGAGSFVLGMIARMFPLKGHEELMKMAPEIFTRWPDIQLRVVGDGPLRIEWEKWLASRPAWLSRVTFTGRVSAENIPHELAQMDAVIHLSLREGLPRVVPQAMAARRPVCTYDVGGVSEIIEHGKTGWLVEPGNRLALLETIQQLRRNIPPIDLERARAIVQKRFDHQHMQRQIMHVYEEGLRPRKTVPIRVTHG